MSEGLANNYQTTINDASGISNSDTSLVVASVTGVPPVPFRILIESEIIVVTAVSGTTFTIVRGQESTAAASHADGITVTHIVTAEGLLRLEALSKIYVATIAR